jgi:polysaccharide pyruvyl transferase WcaK-like protein
VEVGADPIFALGDAASNENVAAADPAAGRRAVVSIRPWYPARAHSADERRAALRLALGRGIRDLVDAGWDVRLVALHWPRDRDEAVRVVDEAGLADRVEIVDRRLDWPALEALVASADLVVTMRYHCLAAAALAGRPTIALAYEPKVTSLGTRIGVPVLDVDAPDLADRLRAHAERTSGDRDAFIPDAATVVELHVAARRIVARALLGRRA